MKGPDFRKLNSCTFLLCIQQVRLTLSLYIYLALFPLDMYTQLDLSTSYVSDDQTAGSAVTHSQHETVYALSLDLSPTGPSPTPMYSTQ